MAVKVVRSIRKYREAAMLEVDVLQHLAKNDRGNSRYESYGVNWILEFAYCSLLILSGDD